MLLAGGVFRQLLDVFLQPGYRIALPLPLDYCNRGKVVLIGEVREKIWYMGQIGGRRDEEGALCSFPQDIGVVIDGAIVRARAGSKGVAKTPRKVKQWENIKKS